MKKLLFVFGLLISSFIFFSLYPQPTFARLIESIDGSGAGGGILSTPPMNERARSCNNGQITRSNWIMGCEKDKSIPAEVVLALGNLFFDPQTGSGALLSLTDLSSKLAFASPPTSTTLYFAELGKNLGLDIAPTAYAASQGVGFRAFYPVLKLWRVMANIAYGLLAVVFVVIGFLIMFRSRLNSQVEITVQTALPRLVITIILIAFSYPIAGLLVDLMYLLIYGFVGFLGSEGLLDAGTTLKVIFNNDPFRATLLKGFQNSAFQITEGTGESVKTLMGKDLGEMVKILVKYIGGAGLWVLLLFFILYVALHIFLTMLKAYAEVILYVALAPIYILGNALPGSQAFSSWLKTLTAKLLVFPVIIFHYILAAILVGSTDWGATGSLMGGKSLAGWSPPLFNFNVGNEGVQAVLAIVALGILYLAPKAAETTENLVKGQLNIDMNQAISGAYQQVAKTPTSWYQKHKTDLMMRKFSEETAKRVRGG